jgi:hypothetical protein
MKIDQKYISNHTKFTGFKKKIYIKDKKWFNNSNALFIKKDIYSKFYKKS